VGKVPGAFVSVCKCTRPWLELAVSLLICIRGVSWGGGRERELRMTYVPSFWTLGGGLGKAPS